MSETLLRSPELTARIAPLGAELQSLATADGRELLWQGDPTWWAGRAPLLFPIVGRAPDDRIRIGAHEAEMRQHGFARRMEWQRVSAETAQCRYRLLADEATRAVYPFAFELTLDYRLDGARLDVDATVTNAGHDAMPFGLGFHPAFNWPLPGAEGAHEVTLTNGGAPALYRLEGGLLVDHPQPSPFREGRFRPTAADFEEDAMIFLDGAGPGLGFGAPRGPRLDFSWRNLPNLALWQRPGAPFLCIEPWHGTAARSGASGEIAERPFTTHLPAGASARFGWSVTVGGLR